MTQVLTYVELDVPAFDDPEEKRAETATSRPPAPSSTYAAQRSKALRIKRGG